MSLVCILVLSIVTTMALAMASHSSVLPSLYKSRGQGEKKQFSVRQVPGDGGCLFHSISAVLGYERSGCHEEFNDAMKNMSFCLRQLSVDTLLRQDLVLVMEGNENSTTGGLLQTVAEHYNTSVRKYCSNMRLSYTWGGGPEIVALSNALE